MFFIMPGCTAFDDAAATAERRVLILAAASTQDALAEIAEALHERRGPTLIVSPAGSNALAQQILSGAHADLFLSANQIWADEVIQHGKADLSTPLLSGQLVMVVPAGNPARVNQPEDLLEGRVRRVALAGEQVPAGMYARQALSGRGLYDDLLDSSRIVRGQNVRFTLAYVERGEADAGIVYASDAAASNVQIAFAFGAKDHERIVYPLVLLLGGSKRPASREVFEYLQSRTAAEIFEKHGFRPLIGRLENAR